MLNYTNDYQFAQEQFWMDVLISENTSECWIWLGSKSIWGYGQENFMGKKIGAHRVSYQISHNDFDDNLVIRHMCNNRLCVNPSHIIQGTMAQNNEDKLYPIPSNIIVKNISEKERIALYKQRQHFQDIHRFWHYVSIPINDSDENCWEWIGNKMRKGYGTFGKDGKVVKAHRFMYIATRGAIPPNMLIMHSCDNRSCVNPNHLSVGDLSANALDMISKNRGNDIAMGQAKPKYTQEQFDEVVKLRKQGLTQQAISDIVGISRGYISNIINGKTSRHKK